MRRRGTEEVVTGPTRNRITAQKAVRGFESHPLRHPSSDSSDRFAGSLLDDYTDVEDAGPRTGAFAANVTTCMPLRSQEWAVFSAQGARTPSPLLLMERFRRLRAVYGGFLAEPDYTRTSRSLRMTLSAHRAEFLVAAAIQATEKEASLPHPCPEQLIAPGASR
jgi:hypothetical protein